MAMPLPIRMQHPYTYSKWDSIHEPYNVVENIDCLLKAIKAGVIVAAHLGTPCWTTTFSGILGVSSRE